MKIQLLTVICLSVCMLNSTVPVQAEEFEIPDEVLEGVSQEAELSKENEEQSLFDIEGEYDPDYYEELLEDSDEQIVESAEEESLVEDKPDETKEVGEDSDSIYAAELEDSYEDYSEESEYSDYSLTTKEEYNSLTLINGIPKEITPELSVGGEVVYPEDMYIHIFSDCDAVDITSSNQGIVLEEKELFSVGTVFSVLVNSEDPIEDRVNINMEVYAFDGELKLIDSDWIEVTSQFLPLQVLPENIWSIETYEGDIAEYRIGIDKREIEYWLEEENPENDIDDLSYSAYAVRKASDSDDDHWERDESVTATFFFFESDRLIIDGTKAGEAGAGSNDEFGLRIFATREGIPLADMYIAVNYTENMGNCGDQLIWKVEDRTLYISGTGEMYDYDTSSKSVEEETDSPPWDRFAQRIIKIDISEGVSSIGESAFIRLRKITEVNLPESLKRIGRSSFLEASRLEEFYIPSGVDTIDFPCMPYYGNMAYVTVSKDNSFFSSDEGVLFDKRKSILLYCPQCKEGNYYVPSTVEKINGYAFMNCEKLYQLHIPANVKSVGNDRYMAFGGGEGVAFYCEIFLYGNAPSGELTDWHVSHVYYPLGNNTYTESTKDRLARLPDRNKTDVWRAWTPKSKTDPAILDFGNDISQLIQEYSPNPSEKDYRKDNYVSGRIVLEGSASDKELKAAGALAIVRGPDNMIVVQFASSQEARNGLGILNRIPGVESTEPDAFMKIEGTSLDNGSYQADSWGSSRINAHNYAAELNTSKVIKVAVVDTGVSPHADLKRRLIKGHDFVDKKKNATDQSGHGTHVAGIIADCTPGLNVQIMPVRVLNQNGCGWASAISSGIRYAVDNDAKVLNLSLGGYHSKLEEKAIRYALKKNVIVVVSAGNEGSNTKSLCPAHMGGVIVVAAIDKQLQRPDFSNYGSTVDICAPGVSISSCYYKGGYVTYDGTSMAAPHVTACAAMLCLKYPNYLPSLIEELIKKNAIDLGETGWDQYYGWGMIRMPVTAVATRTLKLNKTKLTLHVGMSEKLTAEVSKGSGGVKWKSSKPSVAKVSATGKVSGIKKGKAVITAEAGGMIVKCTVTVKKPSIKLSKKKLTLKKGKSKKLKAKVYGKSKKVKWKSSNKKVVRVSKKGKVKAVGKGKAVIYARANGVKAKCKVTVK